jgi:hypothetical protein
LGREYFDEYARYSVSNWIFLAGIYPIGMKIAADYYSIRPWKIAWFLGRRLGNWHSLPTLLKSFTVFPWKYVLLCTSAASSSLLLVPDGPYRKQSQNQYKSTLLCLKQKKLDPQL